jgi:hypothetical protein
MKRLVVAAEAAAGWAFTLWLFFPGYLTLDAWFLHNDAKAGNFGDWQSPVMGLFWLLIDPLSPGPGSLLLVITGAYWLAFALLGLTLQRHSAVAGFLAPVIGLLPPAFDLLFMIWRDVLFAAVWLLAVVMVRASQGTRAGTAARFVAALLVLFGVLLRPNAVLAAPFLFTYILWPRDLRPLRTLLLYVPLALAGIVAIQASYYGLIGARRQNPAHSVMVFDLGGITRFTGQNQFPVTWTAAQERLLRETCYDPVRWDTYWTMQPCNFVMARLEQPGDIVFGTPRLSEAWQRAVLAHPLAWLRHRLTYWWTFMTGDRNLVVEDNATRDPAVTPLANRQRFQTFLDLHKGLEDSILFRPLTWFALSVLLLPVFWRRRALPGGAFGLALLLSGLAYAGTFAAVGVAADFRYGYWMVLASIAAALTAAAAERQAR